jgi:hypothetical protein
MKFKHDDIAGMAKNAFLSCLSKIPSAKVSNLQESGLYNDLRSSYVFKLETSNDTFILIALFKTSGQPRLAREAVEQIFQYTKRSTNTHGVFIAPCISQKSAEICQSRGVGYLDLSGNCLIAFGNVYIEKTGNPNVFKEKRDLRSLYYPKAERVLRVLLCNPNRQWKIRQLAEESRVSLGQASNVKRLLFDREILSGERGGFKLLDPETLLMEWAENYDYQKSDIHEFFTANYLSYLKFNFTWMSTVIADAVKKQPKCSLKEFYQKPGCTLRY